MNIIHTELLRSLIKDLAGNVIFGATFIKRGDGSVREMTCRLGVKAHLQGGELPFDPVEKGLLPVYDMAEAIRLTKEAEEKGVEPDLSKAYRQIPLENLTELRVGGKVYRFEE